jgi:hypothetical protein
MRHQDSNGSSPLAGSQIVLFIEPLTQAESDRLAELESQIDKVRALFDTGQESMARALREIRDSRLYRKTHPNFESYLNERWSISRAHAYRLIDFADDLDLSPVGDKPKSEGEARAKRAARNPKKKKQFYTLQTVDGSTVYSSDWQNFSLDCPKPDDEDEDTVAVTNREERHEVFKDAEAALGKKCKWVPTNLDKDGKWVIESQKPPESKSRPEPPGQEAKLNGHSNSSEPPEKRWLVTGKTSLAIFIYAATEKEAIAKAKVELESLRTNSIFRFDQSITFQGFRVAEEGSRTDAC